MRISLIVCAISVASLLTWPLLGSQSTTGSSQGPVRAVGLPPGSILATADPFVPAGYLACDGSEVDREQYANLFDCIGTIYGDGDGITTFNLPDLRGRFPLGLAFSGLTGTFLGEFGGELDHRHTSAPHTHSVSSHQHSVPSHRHWVPPHKHGKGTLSIAASGNHTHHFSKTVAANANDFGQAKLTRAKAGTFTEDTWGGNTDDATHTHPNSAFQGWVGNEASGNNGDTGFWTNTDGASTTGSGGGGTTGSTTPADTGANNPAYLTLNFIIKV